MNRNYYGADPNAVAAQQLANLFANSVGYDRFGLDQIGADSLAADALAADQLYGADPSPQNAAYRAQAHANMAAANGGGGAALASANMQQLQRRALAMAAGQVPFSATGEQSTQVKTELLPIVPTLIPAGVGGNAGLLAPAAFTFAITPTRSMQINSVVFPSLDAATAGCVLMGLSILGVDQMNGPGGVPCSLLTEVRTHRILKGGTAQAGQQILITIGNATAVDLVIRGTLEGPDLVRVT